METSAWCVMEAVSGQTGITVSCIQHVIQVYLKKNTIRTIMTRMYKTFQSLNVIDKIITIFIHSSLVSMVADERVSHMLHLDIWLLWSFLQPQSFTIFSNMLKNPTVRGLNRIALSKFISLSMNVNLRENFGGSVLL